jgi:hypothetical protein
MGGVYITAVGPMSLVVGRTVHESDEAPGSLLPAALSPKRRSHSKRLCRRAAC